MVAAKKIQKATLSSKGQVVVPSAIREAMGLRAGAEVIFELQPDGSATIVPLKRSLEMFFGRGRRADQKEMSVSEMDEAIADALAKDEKRIKGRP
jgi:antitoxin PrlF